MHTISRLRWAALLAAIAVVPASATFHFMKVVELFPGTAASPGAHYVVLQMYASGQNFVGGHQVTLHDAAGQVIETLTFPGDLPNGANQARILVATPQAQSFFGVAADLDMGASLLKAGGKACFDEIDCVAWGAYAGSAAGVGTPFNAPAGLQSGRAAVRRLDIAGSPTALDSADDTDNSATDFVFGSPAPRNNAGMLGTVPGSVCGNGAVEGLEQCDDGNASGGDGCSSSCAIDQAAADPPLVSGSGDFNGDGIADIVWRNRILGSNAIWLSANSATPRPIAAVTNVDWAIVGIGRFDADSRSDIMWRNQRTGANTIWLSGDAATPMAMAAVTNLSWRVAGIGDFNGDGRSDVFWRNRATGANAIWRSASHLSPQAVAAVANLDWQVVGTGDFDDDGRSDVLWRNLRTGANAIWRSASHLTPLAMTGVTNLAWEIVGIGDYSGDGHDDVFWRNAGTGANVVWRSASAATPQAVTGVGNVSWEVVQSGHYGGDARSDVFWRNRATGANTIWRSASSASPQAVSGVSNLSWEVVP